MFEGNALFDLARFMGSCADGDVRRDCEKEAVNLYYDLLVEKYKEHGAKPKLTREDVSSLK